MNFCMISHSSFAMDNRVRRVAEALVRSGNQVDVICLRKPSDEKRMRINGVNVYGIKKRKDRQGRFMDYLGEFLPFFFLSMGWVTMLFLRRRYDLIHVHNPPDFQIFAAIIPRVFGSKLVLDIHDVVPEFYAQKFAVDEDHVLVRFLKWIEKISAACADHVIVSNNIWEDTLRNRSVDGEKLTVILNAADDRYFYPRERTKSDTRNFTLEYHGTFKEHFGVDVAIRAVDILRSDIPNIKLKMIGAGPLREKLIGLIADLNIEELVDIYDLVPMDRIPEFITEADVGIVPKRGGIFSDNALSTKLLEIVKVGIPAVVSRTPVEKSYFDENMVMFFEPNSPGDLARAVLELYRSPKRRIELVQKANKFNERHNWDHYREVYYGVIDNLCLKTDRK